jgi:hypothetical protein
MSQTSVHIVIARYNESLSWLLDLEPLAANYNMTFYVYDKGMGSAPSLSFATVHYNRLPNIGREAHTYLHHIVDVGLHADIEGITVFMQGRIDDHLFFDSKYAQHVSAMIEDARENGTSSKNAICHAMGDSSAHYNFRLRYYKGFLDPAPCALGPWFETVMGCKFPEQARWWAGAIFAVQNKKMAIRSVEWYTQLRDRLDTNMPELAHFMERSWLYVFSP